VNVTHIIGLDLTRNLKFEILSFDYYKTYNLEVIFFSFLNLNLLWNSTSVTPPSCKMVGIVIFGSLFEMTILRFCQLNFGELVKITGVLN
jgi:hypothetical protein